MKNSKFSTKDIVWVGLMTAIIFVVTQLIRIPVVTPFGESQFKLANALILLAGMMLGGVRGGLAGGLGSMLFDLTNPAYVASAPFTFVNFFMMAFVCGIICYRNSNVTTRFIGASAGGVTYLFLYLSKNIIELLMLGNPLSTALSSVAIKAGISTFNAILAITVSCLIAPVIITALKKQNLLPEPKSKEKTKPQE